MPTFEITRLTPKQTRLLGHTLDKVQAEARPQQ